MKIKTLKIKVEKANQEFDFKDFLTGNNTIHQTTATLQKEKDGLYWHVFMTYTPSENNRFSRLPMETKDYPEGFEDAIYDYVRNNPPNKIRVRGAVISSVERLLSVQELSHFTFLNTIGDTSLAQDHDFFVGLLAIIKKYQIPKE